MVDFCLMDEEKFLKYVVIFLRGYNDILKMIRAFVNSVLKHVISKLLSHLGYIFLSLISKFDLLVSRYKLCIACNCLRFLIQDLSNQETLTTETFSTKSAPRIILNLGIS